MSDKSSPSIGAYIPKTEAFWNGKRIAASEDCISVEGNAYFPAQSLDMSFFTPLAHTSVCSWKGTANYMTISVDGQTNENAAWVYRTPKDAAAAIADYVAFWKGVEVRGVEHAKPMTR